MAKSSTLRFSVAAAAVFALLSGCGGGGGSDPASVTPPVTDTTPPYVSPNQVTPTPGTTIPRSALIMTVKFSETLACPAGIQPLSVKANTGTPLAGNYTCVGDLVTATVTTASLQDANLRSVEFELSGFADLAGNKMAAPYTWSYPVAVPPAKLSYENVVVMLRAAMLFRVDRAVPGAIVPDANTTPWGALYSVGIRAPRAKDCLMEYSGRDQKTGNLYRMLYNPKTGEHTVDTSPEGAAWDRDTDYMYGVRWNPLDEHPEWEYKLRLPDGWYYVLPEEVWNIYFQDNAGAVTRLTDTTFEDAGRVLGLWSFSCTPTAP